MKRIKDLDGEQLHKGLLRVLCISYFFSGFLHVLDIFDARLQFSEMDVIWKTWTVYLAVADLIVAASLWSKTKMGELLFVTIVLSEIGVYLGWADHFGNQYAWLGFHLLTLTVYLAVLTYTNNEPVVTDRDLE